MAEANTTSMEVIEMGPGGEVRFNNKTEFGQVIFHNIARYYPADAHISVTFAITSQLTATKHDWIGLFKVGWVKSSENICYEWVVIPADYKEQQEIETCVLFQAHNLPKDDGEFYQFCYIASGGQVRGASTPFQFRNPRADDFEEAEDEDIDLIIINNRAQHLEERIAQVEMEKQELLKSKEALDADRESLVEKLVEYQKQVKEKQESLDSQQRSLCKVQEELSSTQAEAKDMAAKQEERIEKLMKEKEELSKTLESKEVEITRLMEELQEVNREKDELCGKVKTLDEEKELYKKHFTNSESAIKAHTLEIENLQKQNTSHEGDLTQCRAEVSEMKMALDKERRDMAQLRQLRDADQEQSAALAEKLKNTEDKLQAAAACKQMLSEETETLKAAFLEMSNNLEKAKSESHSYKDKLAREEKRFKEELEASRRGVEERENALEMIKKEKEKADTKAQDQDEQILALKARLQSEEVQMQNDAAGAAFALQPVLNDLKDRYKRYKNKYDLARIEKENLTRRQEQWKQQEQDLRREVDDLKARLKMGADEYKALHIQYQKATKKLAAKEPKVEKKAPLVEEVLTEVAQQLKATELDAASPSAAAETRADQGGDFEVVTSIPTSSLSIEELQAQFEDLGQELEKRTMKKKMYKQKFLDEREKNDFLRKHYEEELQKKTALISDLNGKIEALEKDSAGNEKKLAEVCNKQKLEITRLSGLLAAERGNKTASYALPPDGLPSPATPPVIMEYGNPYAPVLPPALSPEIRHPAMGNPLLAAESTLLDPPMKPEILPSAKMAAVMAVHKKESSSENSSSSSTTDGDDFPTEQDLVAPPAEEPSKKDQTAEEADTPDGEEEKFEDAVGMPLPQCPMCNKQFQGDDAEAKISEHIDREHTGPECPMCHKSFSVGTAQTEFERHVQSHFDEQEYEFA